VTLFRILVIVLFIHLAISGCKSTEDGTDRFGESYRNFFTKQVISPEGPQDPSAAETLPGALGSEIYQKRYIKGMTEEPEEEHDTVSRGLRDLQ
jgi:hypothetical protein